VFSFVGIDVFGYSLVADTSKKKLRHLFLDRGSISYGSILKELSNPYA
jgi:hypothetical protein